MPPARETPPRKTPPGPRPPRKTLALDFGERRIGLALSDPDGRLALPLTTLQRTDDRSVICEIVEVVEREEVQALVLGDPVNVDGSRGEASERVHRFAAKLAEATGLEPTFVVETLTTVAARERLVAAGVDVRKNPERLDATAAQILLEEALARQSPEREVSEREIAERKSTEGASP